jgi:hypothetical protein
MHGAVLPSDCSREAIAGSLQAGNVAIDPVAVVHARSAFGPEEAVSRHCQPLQVTGGREMLEIVVDQNVCY